VSHRDRRADFASRKRKERQPPPPPATEERARMPEDDGYDTWGPWSANEQHLMIIANEALRNRFGK
jgi:hypothetical protein